jgi:hypothetical protein
MAAAKTPAGPDLPWTHNLFVAETNGEVAACATAEQLAPSAKFSRRVIRRDGCA